MKNDRVAEGMRLVRAAVWLAAGRAVAAMPAARVETAEDLFLLLRHSEQPEASVSWLSFARWWKLACVGWERPLVSCRGVLLERKCRVHLCGVTLVWELLC